VHRIATAGHGSLAAELGVLGLVNDSHATAAELFKDLVVRNDLPS